MKSDDIFYVYEHHDNSGMVFYVGKGKKRRAWQKRGRSRFWNSYVKIHGFNVKIVYSNLTEQSAMIIEKELILQYGRRDLGTGCLVNLTDGGDGASGRVLSQEQRDRISFHSKNKTPEVLAKMSASNRGQTRSEETKKKLSEARRLRITTAETREKMKQAHKNRPKKAGCYSNYKGITFDKKNQKWVARIRSNGKTKNLGRFASELEAIQAYRKAESFLNACPCMGLADLFNAVRS